MFGAVMIVLISVILSGVMRTNIISWAFFPKFGSVMDESIIEQWIDDWETGSSDQTHNDAIKPQSYHYVLVTYFAPHVEGSLQ